MKEIKFENWANDNEFVKIIYYGDKQIGTIRQLKNDKFYCDCHKSEFNWIDMMLNNNQELVSFDLDELESNIVVTITDVYKSLTK